MFAPPWKMKMSTIVDTVLARRSSSRPRSPLVEDARNLLQQRPAHHRPRRLVVPVQKSPASARLADCLVSRAANTLMVRCQVADARQPPRFPGAEAQRTASLDVVVEKDRTTLRAAHASLQQTGIVAQQPKPQRVQTRQIQQRRESNTPNPLPTWFYVTPPARSGKC